MIAFPVVWFFVVFQSHSVRGLWTWNHYGLCWFQLSIHNAEIIHLQSALDDEYNDFSGNIKPVPHLEPKNYSRTFTSLRSSFINVIVPFIFAKKRCNSAAGFGTFFFQSFVGLFFLLFAFSFFSRSFLIFMVTSDWVLNQLRLSIFQISTSEMNCGILPRKKYYFRKLIIVELSFTTLWKLNFIIYRAMLPSALTCAWTGARVSKYGT